MRGTTEVLWKEERESVEELLKFSREEKILICNHLSVFVLLQQTCSAVCNVDLNSSMREFLRAADEMTSQR